MPSDSHNPISIEIARGSYQFKVENSKTKECTLGQYITTPEFSAGGHTWHIRYYPQGSCADNKGTYISFCLKLLTSSENVTANYELGVLNKYGRPTEESWIRSTDTFNRRTGWIYNLFMKRSDLESDYIRDDYFIIVCSITVINESCAMLKSCSLGVFPNNLAEELRSLLEGQEEIDVTFEIEGENISAHKLILASRSPVFKAELFGPMAEANCNCIKIDDMKPLVFKAMLYFMYTDSVPDVENLVSEGTSNMHISSAILHQHLLVAADRYALEGLKRLSLETLCRTISIDTVVSSLAVAEQHDCTHLKEACLEFIAEPENFVKVAVRKEYASLGTSCPSLLDELQRKIESAADHK